MLSIFPRDQRCTTHRQAHRGIIWENSRAFVPEWHRGPLNTGDSANVTVWKHQSVNKTLLCGSKGFQHCRKKQGKKNNNGFTFLQWVRERGLEWDWKEKIVTITLERQRKYTAGKKIIKMVIFILLFSFSFFFFNECRCSLALSKLIVAIISEGERVRKKEVSEGPIVGPAHIKRCDIVAVKW